MENATMQQAQLGLFIATVIAWVVCGCILTRRPTKKLPTLRAAASDEHQPGCFALEEEKGGHWTGSGVPIIKEARPTL
jgi:hypothetical protein